MLTVAVQIDAGNLRFEVTPADIEEITRDQAIRMRTIITDNFLSLGGRNFYGDAAKGTHSSASGNVATVTVSRVGVRLRWLGSDGLPDGVVKPGRGKSSKTGQPTKLLAVPARDDDSYPGDVGVPLAFVAAIKGKQRGLLMEAERRPAKRGHNKGRLALYPKKDGTLYFRLVTETKHDPNPEVMPTQDTFETAVRRTAATYLKLKNRRRS